MIVEATSSRVSLVTGGTGGIGRAVALRLAKGGDRILFVGRSPERGAEVLAALREAGPQADHIFLPADLSLLRETARVADEVARYTDRLDAAVFCAGILSTVPEWTDEGMERNFVLNYLARYLLGRRLLPLLSAAPSGRLVLVSNAGKYGDTLDFDDLQHRRGKAGMRVSGRTQFANYLFAVELSDRLRGSRVEVTCVYPGLTKTEVFGNAVGLPGIARLAAPVVLRLFGQAPEVAAETPSFLAQDPAATGTGGRFYGPELKEIRIPRRARRPSRRHGLWSLSEELVRPYLRAGETAVIWNDNETPHPQGTTEAVS
jgi:NAD(P)-dependent dehydrogenase (short-subunit alcohol dehydrogenase family)